MNFTNKTWNVMNMVTTTFMPTTQTYNTEKSENHLIPNIIHCPLPPSHIHKRKGKSDNEYKHTAKAVSLVELVGKITLLSDLTLCPSKRVVLRKNSDGS